MRYPKRAAAYLLAVLFVLLPLTGCGEKYLDEFTILAEAVPTNLDPQLATSAEEQTVAVNLFEGLYRRGTDGTPQPAAAQSVEITADGLRYTFTLRDGAEWSDGSPVTADDFVFTFERIFDRQTASPWAEEFSGVLSAAAKDKQTLEIRLLAPDEDFPLRLTYAGAMPCNRAFFEGASGAYGLSRSELMGNGAFRLGYWSPGESLTMLRREEQKGYVNTLRFSEPEKEDTRTALQRYNDGEGSGTLLSPAPQNAAQIFQNSTWVLLFKADENILAERDVRAALAGAALQGGLPSAEGQTAASGLVPPGIWGERQAAYTLPESPAALYMATMRALGLETPTLQVLLPEGYEELFTEVNHRWQTTLSCYFALQSLPIAEVQSAVTAGNYTIALLPLYAQSGSAYDMLSGFANGRTGWYSETFDTLLATGQYAAAEALLLEEWACIPLVHEASGYITRGQVQGLSVNPFGPVLDFAAD